MISLIDTHSHLDTEAFDADRDDVITAARAASIDAVLLIGYDRQRWRTTQALCERYPLFVRAAGLHPNSAEQWNTNMERDLNNEIAAGQIVAIGETGLDYYRDHASPTKQRAAFNSQLELARQFDLPVIIHQRSAEADILDILAAYAPVRGVMHCFSGTSSFAERCIELGLHLGVGGVVTYPKSTDIRVALERVPDDTLLLETDAPFLAPQGNRGKRNEPAFMRTTLEVLANLRGQSPEQVARITTENAERLFGGRLRQARLTGKAAAKCLS